MDGPKLKSKFTNWLYPLVVLSCVIVFFIVAYLAGPSTSAAYLNLQAESDGVHRYAVFCLPICLVVVFIFWPISRVFGEFTWIRRVTRGLVGLAWLWAASTAGYVVGFDSTIEQNGLRGQFERSGDIKPKLSKDTFLVGPFKEGTDGPGIATSDLPSGEHLTLDRNSLALRTATGAYKWNRARSGRWPASISVAHETVFVAGPGPEFEDDVVVTAVELRSGRKYFDFHCLGNSVTSLVIEGANLAFCTRRQSVSSVNLIDWIESEAVWSVSIPGLITLEPRLSETHVEVALGAELIELSRKTGKISAQRTVCNDPTGWGVACHNEQVVNWISKGKSGEP
ncbi:MAG: hypothetical protein JRJ19_03025 [Deltaproteobacteria bacterium]|nr:hypothetical protein [Deltaproteobacteria bacterium]